MSGGLSVQLQIVVSRRHHRKHGVRLAHLRIASTFDVTRALASSGLGASIFRFSPIVEHFLQNFGWNQGSNQLPLLQVDAKTPHPHETPDLMKVGDRR